jgi:hypothetical protein
MFLIHGVISGISKGVRNALSFDVRFQTNKLATIPYHVLVSDSRDVAVLDFSKFKLEPVRAADWVTLRSTRFVATNNKQFSTTRVIADRHAHECMCTISPFWLN